MEADRRVLEGCCPFGNLCVNLNGCWREGKLMIHLSFRTTRGSAINQDQPYTVSRPRGEGPGAQKGLIGQLSLRPTDLEAREKGSDGLH